jgi:hypothetical protein
MGRVDEAVQLLIGAAHVAEAVAYRRFDRA